MTFKIKDRVKAPIFGYKNVDLSVSLNNKTLYLLWSNTYYMGEKVKQFITVKYCDISQSSYYVGSNTLCICGKLRIHVTYRNPTCVSKFIITDNNGAITFKTGVDHEGLLDLLRVYTGHSIQYCAGNINSSKCI